MRNLFLGTLLLFTFGLTTGCDKKGPLAVTDKRGSDHPVTKHERAEQVEEVEQATERMREAAHALQDYAYVRKDEFVANMKKELADIQAAIDLQAAKAERSATAEIKEDLTVAIKRIRLRYVQAQARLEAAEKAAEDRWDEAKAGFVKAYDELKEAVKDTSQWGKDAP